MPPSIRIHALPTLLLAAAALLAPRPGRAGEAVQALLDGYASVPQLSCELRRDIRSGDGDGVRILSRIWFRRPDRLHAENLSPMKRRTVCDGTTLRQYTEGLPRGFARPVAELEGEALVNLRMLPGSNSNWLEPLRALPETDLPPADAAPASRRIACTAPGKPYAVLAFDESNRWIRLEMYTSPAMADRLLLAEFSDFAEVAPSVWLPRRQRIDLSMDGTFRTETVRLDNLSATAPIPAAMFDAASFFPGVTFTDSFDKMF
jgi:outer membrane lipoprotein-sorting protein